jgi:tyrosine-specific transport protein
VSKPFLGGVLLIGGTATGAGMLALPIITAPMGFLQSIAVFVFCWLFMTASALLLLEVNLAVAPGANLNTLVRATLGRAGQSIAWFAYVMLLYALTAAYITGGAEWFMDYLHRWFAFHLTFTETVLSFTTAIALIVFFGTQVVDYINRALMVGLVVSFIYLITLLTPILKPEQLIVSYTSMNLWQLPALATAFGFHIVIPSLTAYVGAGHAKTLQKIIWVGSIIPLCFYTVWEALILGSIPHDGPHGLLVMATSTQPIQAMITALAPLTQGHFGELARTFLIFALTTSFIGVTLALFDFLRDAFKIKPQDKRLILTLCTFVPPVLSVTLFPAGFIFAIQFAGLFVAILLGILPALMAWRVRYHLQLASPYQVKGGKSVLFIVLSFFVLVSILECQHVIREFLR